MAPAAAEAAAIGRGRSFRGLPKVAAASALTSGRFGQSLDWFTKATYIYIHIFVYIYRYMYIYII